MSEAGGVQDQSSEDFATRFKLVVSSIESLPTLPTILWEVQAALHERQNGSVEIAQVIEQDPSLTGNILRLANSAYFGSATRYVSVVDAVTRIGMRQIGRLVNATLMIDTFSALENTLDYKEVWLHSLQVAEVSGLLADHNPDSTSLLSTDAYMLGLLHDIGKLMLDQYFEEDFAQSRMYVDEHGCPDAEAERSTLGMDHGEMAAELMEYWNLQSSLIESVRYHHNVEACSEEHRANAELISHADGIWHLYRGGELNEDALAHESFSLGDFDLEELLQTLKRAGERASALLS
jgi:putative nucleotidyltransferase with HDIG domain